ncbi:MAG: hypothetical protein V2A67_10205 [Bacteroidota bacterium]
MKKIAIVLTFFPGMLTAQVGPTPEQASKAEDKARTEWAQLEKKGWKTMNENDNPVTMLSDYWKTKEVLDAEGSSYFVYPFTFGNGNTSEEALKDALVKAHDEMTGILALYFQSWNMTNSSKFQKETSAVDKAINKTQADWKKALSEMEGINTVVLLRQKGSKTEVHLRMRFVQEEAKNIMRTIILDYLKKNEGWTDEMGKQFLYYKATKPGISISIGK